MASGFLSSLTDAQTLQESLRAFDEDVASLEKECPKTELIFREIEHPDEKELDPEEILDDPYEEDPTSPLDTFKYKVVVFIRDYCTDLPVPYATVFFRGGVLFTGADGRVSLGYLKGGTKIDISIKANGYIPTRDDTLDNDVVRLPNVKTPPRAGGASNSI